jgi:16S rRNA (uracil1498-N3)-methyltransferase
MKIHRFYTPDTRMSSDFWFKDSKIMQQWVKVLRFRLGQQVVLFDGVEHDRLYKITEINNTEAHLELITEYERKLPKKNVYLFWSLLKKDKNDWVLQKCTELGVSHFIPLIADRSEKMGFNVERAQRIVIEAAEQCGRSDIPTIRDVMHVTKAIEQYEGKVPLLVCEQSDGTSDQNPESTGVLIGPEGGWSDTEKQLFKEMNLASLSLHDFTLRAETACVAVATKLMTL